MTCIYWWICDRKIEKSPVCRVMFESSVRQFNYEPWSDKIFYASETGSLIKCPNFTSHAIWTITLYIDFLSIVIGDPIICMFCSIQFNLFRTELTFDGVAGFMLCSTVEWWAFVKMVTDIWALWQAGDFLASWMNIRLLVTLLQGFGLSVY